MCKSKFIRVKDSLFGLIEVNEISILKEWTGKLRENSLKQNRK